MIGNGKVVKCDGDVGTAALRRGSQNNPEATHAVGLILSKRGSAPSFGRTTNRSVSIKVFVDRQREIGEGTRNSEVAMSKEKAEAGGRGVEGAPIESLRDAGKTKKHREEGKRGGREKLPDAGGTRFVCKNVFSVLRRSCTIGFWSMQS